MKLHLIRHAKTNQATELQNDFNRELMAKGVRQAKELGIYLAKKGIMDEVWCSSANRTKETLTILKNHIRPESTIYFDELYLCSKSSFLELMWKDSSSKDLIIVGHNFGISDLASYFIDDRVELRTGEYICIEFENLARNETSYGLGKTVDQFRFND